MGLPALVSRRRAARPVLARPSSLQRQDSALAQLPSCPARRPDGHVQGLACLQAGDFPGAERWLRRALEEDSESADVRAHLARICLRSGRTTEALEMLEPVQAETRHDADLHLLVAVCLAELGQADGAERSLDAALSAALAHPPCIMGGAWNEVESEAGDRHDNGLEDDGEAYPDACYRDALLRIWSGRPGEALAHLAAALRRNPDYLEARLLAARLWLTLGRPDRAIPHLERSLAARPDYADLHYWLGLARLHGHEVPAAAASLERAVALNRQFARAQRALALAYRAAQRTQDALRAARRGLTHELQAPGDSTSRVLLELLAGRTKEGEARLLREVECHPNYPDLRLALARCRRARGALLEAREACREALELRPDYAAAALELAELELALDHPEAAERALAAVLARQPGWPDVQALLGRARLARGDLVGAETGLREALRLHPSYAAARADLGWALLGRARGAEARAEFARALTLDPLHALPRRQLALREASGSRRPVMAGAES